MEGPVLVDGSCTVHVVHCVDTEGPLYESIDATFERLKDIFNLDLEPSAEMLRRLQAGDVDLGGMEAAVQSVVDPHLLAYNDTWDKVDVLLADCMSPAFRKRVCDSRGKGWVFNWFCVDHVDYDVNPRRRDMGYHNVFDHYRSTIRETGSWGDGLHFHYHPHAFRREAHRCATHWWTSSQSLDQVLSRRVIERNWFPAAHRAGFHVIRPDSHWFLEQFVPFDFSNQAMVGSSHSGSGGEPEGGRLGDWRRAPADWQPYHPAHDDYQVKGSCRRWMARCLNLGTRYRLLGESDVRQAFEEAEGGTPVVLAVTDHDFRDIRPDVDGLRDVISRVAGDFPAVQFSYCEDVDAMRRALVLPSQAPCDLHLSLRAAGGSTHVLDVWTEIPTFGPQPWLALQTTAGTYHHDNFDIDVPFHRWQYVLDQETYPLRALNSIGVAANNSFGVTTVSVLEPASGRVATKHWNTEDGVHPGSAGGAR
jgi:hypothetical protein